MENPRITLERFQQDDNVNGISSTEGPNQRSPLEAPTQFSSEELHLLIEFFELLDQWNRELVQNVGERSEVNLCKVQ